MQVYVAHMFGNFDSLIEDCGNSNALTIVVLY